MELKGEGLVYCINHGELLSKDTLACPECEKELTLSGYKVIRAISESDFATEYIGFEVQLNRLIAIQKVKNKAFSSLDNWKDFENHHLIQIKLKHPFIARMYKYIYDNGQCYLIAEYTDGKSIAEIIQKTGPFPTQRILQICFQVASGMVYAHSQKIYHGLLDASLIKISEIGSVKITGFDFIRFHKISNPLIPLPESHTDIILFGKLLYELLSGKRISLSDSLPTPTEYYPYASPELGDLALKLIKPKGQDKYTIDKIYQILEDIAQK